MELERGLGKLTDWCVMKGEIRGLCSVLGRMEGLSWQWGLKVHFIRLCAHLCPHPQINKQNEQMHALLAIALTMYPMRIDESIHLQLREKYGDKMLRMQKGDPQVYEELFSYSCPKFLSPVVPNYDNVHPNYHKEPFLQQLKVFSDEVQQQAQLSTIRSFLKLYTTMPVAKLAGFLDLTEQEFRIQLLVFKHKMKNLVWTSGISALDGEFQSASEVDFYIDKVWLPWTRFCGHSSAINNKRPLFWAFGIYQ